MSNLKKVPIRYRILFFTHNDAPEVFLLLYSEQIYVSRSYGHVISLDYFYTDQFSE